MVSFFAWGWASYENLSSMTFISTKKGKKFNNINEGESPTGNNGDSTVGKQAKAQRL